MGALGQLCVCLTRFVLGAPACDCGWRRVWFGVHGCACIYVGCLTVVLYVVLHDGVSEVVYEMVYVGVYEVVSAAVSDYVYERVHVYV